MMVIYLIDIFAASPKYAAYEVAIDPQYVIPLFYIVPLLVCFLLRRYSPRLLSVLLGIVFTLTSAYLAFTLYGDYAIWKFVMPIIALLGGLSGMSGWIRLLLKRVKNIGNDDSWIG